MINIMAIIIIKIIVRAVAAINQPLSKSFAGNKYRLLASQDEICSMAKVSKTVPYLLSIRAG
jgi:hypothetical protein